MSTSHQDLGGRGSADIVDAQLHLTLTLGAEAIVAAMDALGIRSVVLDELWGRNERGHGTPCVEFADGGYRPLSPLAQAAALRYPDRFSYLQRVRRGDPQLAAWVPVLASSPGCRSLRIVVWDAQERDALTAGGYDALLGLAQANALPISVLGADMGNLLRDAVARFPDLQFVVDHCGWVKSEAQWADVRALATHRNVWFKWSHAGRSFGRSAQPEQGVQRAFLQALEAFGPDRVLWAGDVTHEETDAPWGRLLSFVQDNPALSQGDKEWVLGKTARRLFKWGAVPTTLATQGPNAP